MSRTGREYEAFREAEEQAQAREEEERRLMVAKDFLLANGWMRKPQEEQGKTSMWTSSTN